MTGSGGIPEDEKDRILKAGYGNNKGFGLYPVSEILSINRASITECGAEGKGATFEISFPKKGCQF